jgi:sarcosine oxidase subunit beta
VSTYDAIIVGAGLQGCSTALHLADRGRGVLLLERKAAGRQASGVNAGGVRRLFRAPEEIPLSMAAMELWHRMETLVGDPCGFQATGQVKIAESDADMRKLAERAALVRSLGYIHEELIDAGELRRLVPAVAPHCVGGLVSRRDGFAEPYLTARAFCRRALGAGVTLRERCPVTALEPHGRLWRVRCGERSDEAPVVVNCAGAWGDRIAAMVGDRVPLAAEAHTLSITARMPHFLDPVVGLTHRTLSFKQMPNGTVLIGGGFHARFDPQTERTQVDFAQQQKAARTVVEVFPIMASVPVVRCWTGIDGNTPDRIPVIGPSPSAAGIYHAFGFSFHGYQLGPIVGRIMADLITTGGSDLPIAPFRVDRFQEAVGKPHRR